LLVEVVADAWSVAQQRGVRVQMGDTPEGANCQADRELVSIALAKMLRDVIARAPSGVEVRCSLQRDGASWNIEIDDPSTHAIQGDAVKKSAARRERAEPGLTLGRAAAERHGGSLEVEARVDQGRGLRLRLPS
jgi:hypothetical protein